MKKFLLPFICIFLILFAGCAQQNNISNSINDLEKASKDQLQEPNINESTEVKSSSAPQDSSNASAVSGNQSNSSTSQPTKGAKVIEIKEKMFIQQCDDIYTNPDEYEDKVIKLEGIYEEYKDTNSGKTYHIIYRKTPGCCGSDGQIGFQFSYNGKMPKPNDWIKVVGTIKAIKDTDGNKDIILHLSELQVSDKRGTELVNY
jgi:uncharacterized membrane protein YcgQ (UPF0703/DUF1980 family)